MFWEKYARLRPYLDQATLWSFVLTGFSIPISTTACGIMTIITGSLGILSGRFFRSWPMIRCNPLVWCIIGLLLLFFIGMFWSIAPWGDRLHSFHKHLKLLYIIFLLPLCFEAKWRNRTFCAFIFAMVITVLLSYVKEFSGWNFGHPGRGNIFHDHIESSYLVAFATYLLAFYAVSQPNKRWWLIALIIIFTYQEFFINDGRTGWVVYIGLFIVFWIQNIGWKGCIYGILGAGILVTLLYQFSPTFYKIAQDSKHSIEKFYQGDPKTSLGYRLIFIKVSWGIIKSNPLLGLGTGSFRTVYQQEIQDHSMEIFSQPHDEYLLVTTELGIIGLLTFLLFFYFQWRMTSQLEEFKPIAKALVISTLLSAFFNSFLSSSSSGHLFVLFTALLYWPSPRLIAHQYFKPLLVEQNA